MDLVVCPSCRFTFSPTPGKAVKCPACMTAIVPADSVPARKANPAPPKRMPAYAPASSERKSWLGLMVVSLVMIAGLIGGGLMIVKTMSDSKSGTLALAAKKSAEPIPEVLIPKASPELAPPPAGIDPEPAPIPVLEPTAKTKAPKVRPIDPVEARPAPVEVPVDAPKVSKIVIRDVPGVTPASIETAVKKGAQFLQGSTATWFTNESHRLGYVALGGLTLLECQTPRSDPTLRQAAEWTRKLAPASDGTYEITLAILFLDRLGDTRDRDLIRTLGARLVAGQDAGGGFTYSCPILSAAETTQLLAYLSASRPRTAPAPLSIDGPDKAPLRLELPKTSDDDVNPPVERDPDERTGKSSNDAAPRVPVDEEKLVSQPPKIRPKNRLGAGGTIRLENAPKDPSGIGARLLQIPAVANRGRDKDQLILAFPETRQTDHSNLQFAVLGMWVARRHGVVSDRALLLAEARMRKLQMTDGRWRYVVTSGQIPDAMICSGILTIALGHAVHQSHPLGLANALAADPHIGLATKALAEVVKNPEPDFSGKIPDAETYLLWSIERVAVLLNLSTIDGKDWYGWGGQILIKHQQPNGSWDIGGFVGSSPHVDSCFALLFLVRSNLVQEVTEQIRLQTSIRSGP
jgi:hypothetical protein